MTTIEPLTPAETRQAFRDGRAPSTGSFEPFSNRWTENARDLLRGHAIKATWIPRRVLDDESRAHTTGARKSALIRRSCAPRRRADVRLKSSSTAGRGDAPEARSTPMSTEALNGGRSTPTNHLDN